MRIRPTWGGVGVSVGRILDGDSLAGGATVHYGETSASLPQPAQYAAIQAA